MKKTKNKPRIEFYNLKPEPKVETYDIKKDEENVLEIRLTSTDFIAGLVIGLILGILLLLLIQQTIVYTSNWEIGNQDNQSFNENVYPYYNDSLYEGLEYSPVLEGNFTVIKDFQGESIVTIDDFGDRIAITVESNNVN